MFNKFKSYFNKSSSLFSLGSLFNGLDVTNAQLDFSSEAQQLMAYRRLPWVSSCINFIGRTLSKQPWLFVDKDGKEVTPRPEILKPFDEGFANLSFKDMLRMVSSHALLTGNAMLLKSRESAFDLATGNTSMFTPVIPGNFRPEISQNGFELLNYLIMQKQGLERRVPNENVIHFMMENIESPFWGVGRIEQASDILQTEIGLESLQKDVMRNSAFLSYFLNLKNTSEEQLKKTRDYINMNYTRGKNRGSIMVMGNDAEVKSLESQQKELQFIDFRKYSRDVQISLFGLTPEVLGVIENSNKATSRESKEIVIDTINAMIDMIERAINHQHVNLIDKNVFFKIKKITLPDVEKIIKLLSNGIITPREASVTLGVPNDSNEDVLDQFFMVNTVSQITGDIKTEVKPDAENETQGGKTSPFFNCKTFTYDVNAIIADSKKSAMRPKNFQFRYIREFFKVRNKLEQQTFNIMKRFFIDQGKRLSDEIGNLLNPNVSKSYQLKQLGDGNVDASDIVDAAFDKAVEDEVLEESMEVFYKVSLSLNIEAVENASRKSMSSAGRALYEGQAFSRLKSILTKGGNVDSSFDVNETTRRDMISLVQKSIDLGDNVNELQDKIISKFSQFSDFRSRRIARTEISHAHESGAYAAYKDLGVEAVDVVGCTEFEVDFDCGKQGIRTDQIPTLKFHPNHIGTLAPSSDIF